MGDVPVDAQRVVDELRAARRQAGVAPRSWLPSASFDSTFDDALRPPVAANEHLGWLHANWDFRSLLAPPPAKGLKGLVKRVMHRLVMAVLAPYFERLQDYIGVSVRAVDTVSRRVDDQGATQVRLVGALRHDLIDFAHHVDERLDH